MKTFARFESWGQFFAFILLVLWLLKSYAILVFSRKTYDQRFTWDLILGVNLTIVSNIPRNVCVCGAVILVIFANEFLSSADKHSIWNEHSKSDCIFINFLLTPHWNKLTTWTGFVFIYISGCIIDILLNKKQHFLGHCWCYYSWMFHNIWSAIAERFSALDLCSDGWVVRMWVQTPDRDRDVLEQDTLP